MPATHMQLFSRSGCPYCRRVNAYLRERQLDIPRITFDPAVHATALRQLNPKMTVPTLDVGDGFALYESFVIMQFLEELDDAPLSPTAPTERARMRLLFDLADNRLGGPMRDFSRAPGDDPARTGLAEEIATVAADALRLIDETGPFALGEHFSMADLSVPPLLFRAIEAGFVPTRLPYRVVGWCAAVLARPSMEGMFPDVKLPPVA